MYIDKHFTDQPPPCAAPTNHHHHRTEREVKTMTYKEALEQGYTDGETKWFRGYVSRRINPDDQPVKTARGGHKYVELPSWRSTQYSIRQYLVAPTGAERG
jgi:hypothetical protein